MATKESLRKWVLEALSELGGPATVIDVARHVWAHHEDDLHDSGDLFFTWQYDIRWAAQTLRNDGQLKPVKRGAASSWELA